MSPLNVMSFITKYKNNHISNGIKQNLKNDFPTLRTFFFQKKKRTNFGTPNNRDLNNFVAVNI